MENDADNRDRIAKKFAVALEGIVNLSDLQGQGQHYRDSLKFYESQQISQDVRVENSNPTVSVEEMRNEMADSLVKSTDGMMNIGYDEFVEDDSKVNLLDDNVTMSQEDDEDIEIETDSNEAEKTFEEFIENESDITESNEAEKIFEEFTENESDITESDEIEKTFEEFTENESDITETKEVNRKSDYDELNYELKP